MKIRIFGSQTLRKKSTLWVSVFVFAVTLGFVAVASGAFGLAPNFLGAIFEKQSLQGKVAGLQVQQSPGNCPSAGLITEPPDTADPFPFSNTINPTPKGQPIPTLSSGQYFVTGTLTINGQLKINGDVEIYADTVNITSSGNVDADATGVNGGAGGIAVHTVDPVSGSITDRADPNPYATDGVGYCVGNPGAPGCNYTTNNLGGGGKMSNYVPPDGAGGGGHGGKGGGGSNRGGQPGGAQNFNGQAGDYAIRMGSGGGGGYCKGGGNNCRGGRGGGSISFYATNFNSQGNIHANGQAGRNVDLTDDVWACEPGTPANPQLCPPGQKLSVPLHKTGFQQAAGGGGAGGGVFISAINANISGSLAAHGGNGGDAGCTSSNVCPENDDGGGGGGGGEIKVFHDANGTYFFSAAVDNDGGQPGLQGAPNTPEAGDGGFRTDQGCTGTTPQQCTFWNFALNDYGVIPTPGSEVYLGAKVNDVDFLNEPITIRHQLDSQETLVTPNGVGIVYGDWEGAKFTATKDHFYKACYSLRAGADASVMPWSNANAFTETRFFTDKVNPGVDTVIEQKIQPVAGSWQAKTKVFQTSWSDTKTTADSYMEFRTGSSIGQWFTGDLDIDNVGVFDCGTTAGGCAAVACDIPSAANLITNPVQNGQFETPGGFDTNIWLRASAAPSGVIPSSATQVTENITGVTNGFMRLNSVNYFPQATTSCGSNCYQWHTDQQPTANADFELYALARVNDDTPCGITLTNSASGTLNSCEPQSYSRTSPAISCPGRIDPVAEITGPFEVCADGSVPNSRDIPFKAIVSAPSSGDVHTYTWSVSGGNPPSLPQPPSGSPTDGDPITNLKQIIGIINNVGTTTFKLKLDVTSEAGYTPDHDERDILVTDCSPGNTPGSYNPDPSEDIHGSGRQALNPGAGTSSPKNKILDWREILGNLF